MKNSKLSVQIFTRFFVFGWFAISFSFLQSCKNHEAVVPIAEKQVYRGNGANPKFLKFYSANSRVANGSLLELDSLTPLEINETIQTNSEEVLVTDYGIAKVNNGLEEIELCVYFELGQDFRLSNIYLDNYDYSYLTNLGINLNVFNNDSLTISQTDSMLNPLSLPMGYANLVECRRLCDRQFDECIQRHGEAAIEFCSREKRVCYRACALDNPIGIAIEWLADQLVN